MKKVSVSDLHSRTSELVREASEGAVIVIQDEGESVAELRPVQRRSKVASAPLPDLTEVWKRMPVVLTDSSKFLEEDR